MTAAYRLYALIALFAASFALVSATSHSPRPLKRVSHPSTLAIDILRPQRARSHNARSSIPLESPTLRHSDHFRLTLSAFGDTYHLHLRPNEDLIHPSAKIEYYSPTPDGGHRITQTVPLLRESVKAYYGEVVAPHTSTDRMRQDAARVSRPAGGDLGWARIMMHHQGDAGMGVTPVFEGAFSVNGVVHHVITKDNYLRNKQDLDPHLLLSQDNPDSELVIWRDTDVMAPHEEEALRAGRKVSLVEFDDIRPPARTCAHDDHPWNTDPYLNPALRPAPSVGWMGAFNNPLSDLLVKRDDIAGSGMDTNFANTIGQTAGCPTDQQVLYLGVAADCEFVQNYGSTQNATTQILTDFNTASALYKNTFNVSLGVVTLQVQEPTCPSSADPSIPWNVACNASGVDLSERLSLFSQWRGDRGDDGAGLWHLMSGCPSGSEVGIAWLATLCQQTAGNQSDSTVSGTGVSTAGRTEWQVVAHEIGHNFGAIHDCTDGCNSTSSCCPLSISSCDANSQYLMSPVAETGEQNFSPCSIGNVCSLMQGTGRINSTCLQSPDPQRQTISLQQCGNGIVESGEDCDPGSGTNSTCCDVSTCRFRNGAVCDPASSPCCTDQCSLAPATTVCRPARDSACDTQETCTGNSSSCPSDVFSSDGTSCGSNGLACASGQCTSRDLQCQQQGSSLNLQEACPNNNDRSCRVSCRDPNNSNSCISLDTQLIDGSPCGYAGHCQNGNCQSGSALATFNAWYRQNLQISIPVTIAIVVIVILIIYGIVACCCRRRGRNIVPGYKRVPHHRHLGSDIGPLIPPMGPPVGVPPTYSSVSPAFPTTVAARQRAMGHERRTSSMAVGGGNTRPYAGWGDPTAYNGPNLARR